MKLLDTTVAVDHLRGATSAIDLLRRLVDEDGAVAASEDVAAAALASERQPTLTPAPSRVDNPTAQAKERVGSLKATPPELS